MLSGASGSDPTPLPGTSYIALPFPWLDLVCCCFTLQQRYFSHIVAAIGLNKKVFFSFVCI
jgi:hypothetical protein